MRQNKIVLCMGLLLLSMWACSAATDIRAAQTEIPAMMTSAPTMLGPLETAAAQVTPSALLTALPGVDTTPNANGLGIALDDVKTVLGLTSQFSFTDGSVDGKPAAIAKLTSTAASTFPVLADGFSAAFIGDAKNLTEIKVVAPRTEEDASVTQGLALLTTLFAGILPADVQLVYLPWISENYSSLKVNDSKELTSGNIKFTLARDEAGMILTLSALK